MREKFEEARGRLLRGQCGIELLEGQGGKQVGAKGIYVAKGRSHKLIDFLSILCHVLPLLVQKFALQSLLRRIIILLVLDQFIPILHKGFEILTSGLYSSTNSLLIRNLLI